MVQWSLLRAKCHNCLSIEGLAEENLTDRSNVVYLFPVLSRRSFRWIGIVKEYTQLFMWLRSQRQGPLRGSHHMSIGIGIGKNIDNINGSVNSIIHNGRILSNGLAYGRGGLIRVICDVAAYRREEVMELFFWATVRILNVCSKL